MGFMPDDEQPDVYTYRGVKVRFKFDKDSSLVIQKFSVYVELDRFRGEELIHSGTGPWPDDEPAELHARVAAADFIDGYLPSHY